MKTIIKITLGLFLLSGFTFGQSNTSQSKSKTKSENHEMEESMSDDVYQPVKKKMNKNSLASKPLVRMKKIETMKVGFFTNHLNLTPEEAKVFWPVYNQKQNELRELQKSKFKTMQKAKVNFNTLSDAELTKMVDDLMDYKEKELQIEKKYHKEFKKALPIRKVALLYHAENKFKKILLNQIQDKKMIVK